MDDGFHRINETEARFVRNGKLERLVELEQGASPTVSTTRNIQVTRCGTILSED